MLHATIEVSRRVFQHACEELRRVNAADEDCCLDMAGDDLRIRNARFEVRIPARGTWAGVVILPGESLLTLARTLIVDKAETIPIRVEGGRLIFDDVTVSCQWLETYVPPVPLPVDRRQIDPDGRYPADGLRLVERNAQAVLRCMPGATLERTRDAIQIELLGPLGLVALVTAEAVELRIPYREMTRGQTGPARSSKALKRIALKGIDAAGLQAAIDKALRTP